MSPHRMAPKLVAEVIDIQVDFTLILDTGETIIAATWSASNIATGAAESSILQVGGAVISGAVCSQRVIGGTADQAYELRCQATTSAGRVYIERLQLPVAA